MSIRSTRIWLPLSCVLFVGHFFVDRMFVGAVFVGNRLYAGEEPATPIWTMPDAQRQAIVAVVERAIAAGLPDAKGGKLFQGKIKVTRAEEPPKDGNDGKKNRQSNGQTYDGLHLKLADGTWVVSLQWPLAGAKDVTIEEQDLKEVAVDQIRERADAAAKAQGWDARTNRGEQLKMFAVEQQPMLNAAMDLSNIQLLMRGGGDMAVPAAHLIRLGMPRGELLALNSSGNLMWNDDVREFMEGLAAPLRLLPSGMEAEWHKRQERFEKAEGLRLPDLAQSLRRTLTMAFIQQLSLDQGQLFPAMPADKAAAAALAMLDPADPATAVVKAEIEKLQERAKLPGKVPDGADLATRLALTSGPNDGVTPAQGGQFDDAMLEQYAQMSDEQVKDMPEEIRTAITEYRKRSKFTEADLGALVALVGDRRPSRWLDRGHPRTVGDNALRAMATVLSCDPRALIKRDASVRWTAAERDATAQALAVWWKDNQGKPLAVIIASVIENVPPFDLANLLKRSDETQRKQLLDLIAKTWAAKAPAEAEPQSLAQILFTAKGHAGLDAVVTAWPVSGKQELLLAAWHLMHDDGKPFDALLAKELEPKADTDAVSPDGTKKVPNPQAYLRGMRPSRLLAMAYRHPSAERLTRLLTLFGGPLAASGAQPWFNGLTQALWSGGDEVSILWGNNNGMMRSSANGKKDKKEEDVANANVAIPLALFGVLLKNQHPASKEMTTQYANRTNNNRINAGDKPKVAKPIASDLRICDVAAAMFGQTGWNLRIDQLAGDNTRQRLMKSSIDLTDEVEVRDKVIGDLRRIIADALPMALKSAGLPEALPGVTDVPATGDDKVNF